MQTRDVVEGLPNFREGGLGEFETVVQTRDVVEGLHNFREFSQPSSCLDKHGKVLYCLTAMCELCLSG